MFISASETLTVESNEVIYISWLPTLLPNTDHTSNVVDINIYEIQSGGGSLRFIKTLGKDIPNSGSAQVNIALDSPMSKVDVQPITPVLFQISLAKSQIRRSAREVSFQSLLESIHLWSMTQYLKVRSLFDDCEEWYATEDSGIGEKLLEETECCPRTVGNARSFRRLKEETGVIAKKLQGYFHPSADTCFRQKTPRLAKMFASIVYVFACILSCFQSVDNSCTIQTCYICASEGTA